MKILIAYYSKTHGTETVAKYIEQELINRNHTVDVEIVKPTKEHGFTYWSFVRMFKNECEIMLPKITDVSKYDLVLFGTPNWTKLSLPIAKYIKLLKGLNNKKVSIFSTTAFIPSIEWYFFSAYFLDLTFTRSIDAKNARGVGSLLLSSNFEKWSIDSEWGINKTKQWIDLVTAPIGSLQQYILEHQEKEGIRSLIISYPAIILVSLVIKLVLEKYHLESFTWDQYIFLIMLILIAMFGSLVMLQRKVNIHYAKYFSFMAMITLWTFISILFNPDLGRLIFGGYVLILIFTSLFRDVMGVIASGLTIVIAYLFMGNILGISSVNLPVDLFLVAATTAVLVFATYVLQKQNLSLIETQDQLERALNDLEAKMIALQNEETKIKSIIENLADGLIVLDKNSTVLTINSQAVKQLELDTEREMIGLTKNELLVNSKLSSVIKLIDTNTIKSEILFENGNSFEISISMVKLNQENMILIHLHDVTERNQLAEMKVDFASIAAHELRTPITSIKGYLSMLSDEIQTSLSKENQFLLERIMQSSKRLDDTVESLLAVTRVEKGQSILTREPINFETLMTETVNEQLQYAQTKNQTLIFISSVSEIPPIMADKFKVKEVINNLITNAIKYTQREGRIEVTAVHQKNEIIVSVKDNGPGIPIRVQQYLFAKFVRGENALRTETQGVGLGLFLVKSLVEMQGGRVWCDSIEGKGTTFSFSLPVS